MNVTDIPEIATCPDCGATIAHGVCPTCAFGGLIEKASDALDTTADGERLDCQFGRYQLQRRLASGGMGVIYEAEDTQLKRTVALKMIRGAAFADDQEMARFTIESEAAAKLDHPHIVPIYEVGTTDQQPFFTMKLIEGQNLATVLSKTPNRQFGAKQTAETLMPIAQAVHHAHQRGVLHRDLKPANILLEKNGHCWLSDFGLAKLDHHESGLTRSTDHLGTPNYMAPELVDGSASQASTAMGDALWGLAVCWKEPSRNDAQDRRRGTH